MILLTESGTLNELKINKGKISNDGGLTAFKDAMIENQPDLLPMTSFEIPGVKLGHFLTVLDSGYRRNPYHNSIHAADVMHSAFYFIHQKISFDSGRFAGRRFKSGRDVY